MPQGFKQLSILAARAADKKKGEDILLLDVHKMSSLTDFVMVVSVTSPAHLEAVEQEISEVMEASGVGALHQDGTGRSLWRVLDYGGLMVHLLQPAAREFYQIEKLYHEAPKRHWEEPASNGGKSRPRGVRRRKTINHAA